MTDLFAEGVRALYNAMHPVRNPDQEQKLYRAV